MNVNEEGTEYVSPHWIRHKFFKAKIATVLKDKSQKHLPRSSVYTKQNCYDHIIQT